MGEWGEQRITELRKIQNIKGVKPHFSLEITAKEQIIGGKKGVYYSTWLRVDLIY